MSQSTLVSGKPVEARVMCVLMSLIGAGWADMWTMPWARAVAGVVILCILIAFSFYVVSTFRDYTGKDRQEPYFADSNLQEMLRRGDISEAEFRTIQSKSYGASINGDRSPRSSAGGSSLNPSTEESLACASHDDETKRRNNFLPPPEPD